MWQGCAQSRRRCGRDAPSPGADVARHEEKSGPATIAGACRRRQSDSSSRCTRVAPASHPRHTRVAPALLRGPFGFPSHLRLHCVLLCCLRPQVLFIPVFWFHRVLSLEMTVSVNEWINFDTPDAYRYSLTRDARASAKRACHTLARTHARTHTRTHACARTKTRARLSCAHASGLGSRVAPEGSRTAVGPSIPSAFPGSFGQPDNPTYTECRFRCGLERA
jgi:hypothetical protein